jgi:Rad3-related DNA helicase
VAEDLLPDVDELVLAGEEIQDAKIKEGYVPASHVLSLADFKIALRGAKPIIVREGRSIRLEAPADPVETLRATYDGWYATITVSATISGELLESLIGREAVLLRAGWPFEEDNLRAILVKGLTTKFERRDETLINDMAWAIDLAVKRGLKTLIFFPSFELLERALGRASRARDVIAESPGLTQEDVERIIAEYVEDSRRVLLSVYNGRLAEGVDLSANMVICLGIPFAPPTARQQALLKRLSEVLGDEKRARIYGQIIPAMWSAIQAAGRAVRGPRDRAVVFLVDDRYRPLLRLLPRWFSERIVRAIRFNDLAIAVEGEVA